MEDNLEQGYGGVFIELLLALKEKLIIIIAVTLAAAMLGWGISSFLIAPKYEASVNMIVNTRTDFTVNVTNDNISSAQNLVDTYAIIIKSNIVLNPVIETLDLNTSYNSLCEQVEVNAINNTQVMKISVQDEDAARAVQIVDTIAKIAPDIITDAVEAGSCKVVSLVSVADDPVYPDVQQNTLIVGLLGMLICVSIIGLKELMNDYIVDDYDVQNKLKIPVLGIIPDVEGK